MKKRIFLIITMSLILSGCLPKAFLSTSSSGAVGQAGVFIQGKAVKGFPALPLYPKAKLLESYGANSTYGASAISGDGLSKIVDFYNKSLPPLGWELQLVQNSQTNFVFDIKNSSQQGVVIVNTAADGKKTAITISVASR
jgi:hypothetical protein